jgi:hypothetical protein
MHPRLLVLPRSVSTQTRSAYVCPICRFCRWRTIGPRVINATPILSLGSHVSRRKYSSTVSTTAIDARKPIPAAFQELHASLSDLEEEASIYINPSQLQLALRGLESENAVTRVAGTIASRQRRFSSSNPYVVLMAVIVLGVNGQRGACRLVRVLLADPLRPESEWERQLADGDETDGRSLLLRLQMSKGRHWGFFWADITSICIATAKSRTLINGILWSKRFPSRLQACWLITLRSLSKIFRSLLISGLTRTLRRKRS